MAFLPRPVTRMMFATPAATASSTPYWMIGLSTSGSISLGCALVAGRNRVPSPAAGKTAFRICRLTASLRARMAPPHRTPTALLRYRIYLMLDPAYVREHMEDVRTGLRNRGLQAEDELEQLATLEARRRRLIPELEGLKREQNAAGDEIARAKRQGLDASGIFAANKARSQQIRQLEIQVDQVEQQRAALLMTLPNLPHSSVPVGASAAENAEVRRWGNPPEFDFEPKAHYEIGPALGILDFERATRMSGTRFSVLLGAGARLARALINFMLDLHTREHGYTEIEPPFMVNSASLTGTGNLPKFEADLFKIAGDWDLYMVPTAEVPLTNMHRGEILGGRRL